ncbi:MAG: S8 family serine peptidase [Oscillospiraceae bacterium]|nr:S8 family serine peptidase [Oscillospiraceae bacterium]
MKKRLSTRVLSLLLVAALLMGLASPAAAIGNQSSVTITQVDNSAVSVNPLNRNDEELHTMVEYLDHEIVRVSIVLEKASTIKAGFSTMDIADNKAAMAYRADLKKEQVSMVQRIEKATGNQLDVVWNLTLAANLISANVPYGQIEAIKALPGVQTVVLETRYEAIPVEQEQVTTHMATSGTQTGSTLAWADGYTGAGTRIAVVDTGTDTDHQSLSAAGYEYALSLIAQEKGMTAEEYIATLDLLDAEEIAAVAGDLNVTIDPARAYLNTKLPYAFNYKDGDYDVTHDNDEEGEHGSHVAGIATANSWLYSAGTGEYGKALDYCFMQGVAPEAQLLTMKVFGKGGSPYDSDYFAAIEDAIVLGADVINLSLGSVAPGRGTHNNKVFQAIMDELQNTDTVVSISAGNSGPWSEMAENNVNLGGMGYLYNTDVALDTVGQPGSFTNSLAVASVENDGMIGFYIDVAGQMIVYNEDNRDGQFTNQPFTSIAGEHEYIFLDAVGKAEDWAKVADVLPGKIALCSRGETNFVEKATLAVEAGAIAVFIYNNQSGVITLDLTEYQHTAPVAALTQAQGAAIRAASTPVLDESGNVKYLTGKMTVSDTIGMGQFDSAYYTMSDFSSWGVPGSLEMKPEITAPGGNIYSILGSTPENGTGTGGYVIMSGTSMASPQVAGMSALLAQFVRENGLAEKTGMSERHLIQSLLMSTAQPLLASEGVYWPILQQGAGMANVHDAMQADSYLTMAPGTNSGAEDGKIKVELFDDPDRTGSYKAAFTVHNLTNEEQILDLSADFFVQALASDGEFTYLDYTTTMLSMNVAWYVGGVMAVNEEMTGCDFNGDGSVTTADGQALLDFATGVKTSLNDLDNADVDGDGDIDSHDAYVFLKDLSTTSATLPAGGTVEIVVMFDLPAESKAMLDEGYPNGTYIQGFLYAATGNTTHSIPVLGFYGNWSDPGMFDIGQWTTFATGEDTRIPYIGRARGNDFKVMYEWDPGYNYSFGGNPVMTDSKYMPERNAINSNDAIDGVSFIAIRHADDSRVTVTNETTGETIMDQTTGPVNMAYYYGALGWQNSGMTLTTNFSLKGAAEGDKIAMDFTLVPEYYIDENGNVDWDALGKGATLSTSFYIDNTAPELYSVSIDVMNNTMTVKASDNNYVAAVGLYNKTGTRVLAQTGAKQEIAKGETAEYTFSLDAVNGKKFLLQVFDYAMNRATYMIEMQIGESTDLPEMMAYDLVSRHWCGFDKTFEYDYKVGTPRIAFADHIFYAATIAEHYVFASTNKGELYVMPEDDLTDTTFITDLDMVLYDMAYNMADGEIYGVTEFGELVYFHKLTGEVTKVGKIGVNTNTLACSPEGVFYCNELGTGKVYSFTLETMDEPQLLMEDPYLTYVDPIMGADMGGTTGNMGMEYNPNTGMICWNSHCEVLIGSYITYAYYYEIDPENGEFTRYADFWHEMGGLIIPVRNGGDQGWADPTDTVLAVKLNKSETDVIRGTSAQLTANVQPWTATDRTVTWTSADASIATVDKNGVVTGLKEGTTTIRATSNLDPDFYAECVVNVEILQTTLHGTLSDENGQSMFYDWDLSQENGWTAGNKINKTMTSATWSDAEKVFYMMDNVASKWEMHKVDLEGNILASAPNTNSIAFWDMAYNPYFSEIHGEEQISATYYYYLLSPKNPMNMNAVGFNLGDLADYLVGITSLGYEVQYDENGVAYDTEHLVLMDNDGYVWDFWIYDVEGGGMNALYNISKSNITCEFAGDDTMDNLYTSLMAGEDGALYLSTFTGTTNEVWHLHYDVDAGQYVAVKLGTFGENVWPATITSVTTNYIPVSTDSPAPMYTMEASEISENELKAAGSRASFTVSAEEMTYKTNAAGTKDDPITLVPGSNSGTAPKTGSDKYCYFTYTAASEGTVTVSSEGTDWRANYYVNGEQQNLNLINPKYDGNVITCDLAEGDTFLLMISPYKSYMYGGDITVDFAFSGEGGEITEPTDPVEPEPTDPTEPEPSEPVEEENVLVLGTNALVSGTRYTYTANAEGRVELDFVLKDADGKTIYQYAYGKGTRAKIFINDVYAVNLENTKVSVKPGDKVTVEIQSIDGGAYTASLTLTALEPASKLAIGDNAIARKTDYSFIADRDGTLYTTIKELYCDNAYCSEASLSSSVVFRINGSTIYSFKNSYDVKAGDEITVLMNTQFGEPANAVLNLSWDGFYEHPFGTRGNPVVVTYAQMPTSTVKIPAGTAYWFKFTGFPASAEIHMTGADGAYIIYGGQTIPVPAGKSINFNSVRTLQIGNSGTEDASFELYYTLIEGSIDNPRDLVEGKNTVTIDESDNFFYDFVAEENGTATFTVSGDDWRFFYSLLAADGTALVDNEDHQAKRGDADTVTVDMTAGQSIVIKLGTLNASWTAPGGKLTVDFHFEPEAVEPEPTEPEEPENLLVLGKNDLESGVEYGYVVPADGRMEFAVGSVYNSAGSKQYSWYNGTKLNILIDGKPMTSSSAKRNVKAGQVITVMIESLDGDTFTADMTLKNIDAAEALVLGENAVDQNLEYVYTAEQDGTLYFSVVEMLYNGNPVNESVLGSSVQMTINGSSVSTFNKSYEVQRGDELALVIKDYSWDGSGVVNTTVHLSYEGFFEHPAGSLGNPVKLMFADCPTDSIEIAAGAAAWYELESYYDESAWSTVYPFDGKYLVVTGENAFVDVEGTVYNAENGIVKVLMDDETLIQIGNAGSAPAVFGISVEIPEGHVDNPQDLIEGENKITLPSYGTHYYDFHATEDGTVTVTVSGENWKYTFAHYDADGTKLSTKDYYAKNGDSDTVTLELTAGQYITVCVGTSKGYSQPGGDITVSFHFEPAQAPCEHLDTVVTEENKVDPTCTADGSYEKVTSCADCGEELSRESVTVPALGHDYQDGTCANCGEADPNVPDNTVTLDVATDVDVTNGVITVTWDPAKLTLTDYVIHADYTSILEDEGKLTFGYVALSGIPAGEAIATLTFEAVDPADAVVTIVHDQRNNENAACTEHNWSDWTENALAQMERKCLICGKTQVNPFVDVPMNSYYLDSVLWALENGITTGTSSVTFSPSASCSRAQVVTFLWRAAGSPEPTTTENPFVDVEEKDFYYKAVLWAQENRITNGMDATHFGPLVECNRAQVVTFLWRAEGSPAVEGECVFTDVEDGSFYDEAVLWASQNGIASGLTATTFGPDAVCNRAQIVTFLYRAYA